MHPQLLHYGGFVLPTFAVLAALGLIAGLSLSLRAAAALGLNPDRAWDAGLFMLIAAFVLSRLLLIAANMKSFLSYPLTMLALPSLTATGILCTILVTLIYLHFKQLPLLSMLDAWAPCATLVWSFLALGHYAEGSDPGMITRVPWRIASPTGLSQLHPVALYAAIAAAVLTVLLMRRLSHAHPPGQTAAVALAAAGLAQFLITFYRQPNTDDLPDALAFLDPIQWAAIAMVAAAGLLLLCQPKKSRKPVTNAL